MLEHGPENRHISVGDGLSDPLLELCDSQRVDRVDRRQVHGLDRLTGGALDGAQHIALPGSDEQDGLALASRPARAADAVHVGFRVVRHVVVHDMADSLDVEAAGGDIGGHHDVDLAGFQTRDGALALGLGNVAVERSGGEAPRLELFRQFHRRLLGAGEYQHAVEGFGLEYARQRIQLVHAADYPVSLADVGRGAGLALDRDFDRRAQMFRRYAANRRGECGREQGHLPLRRRLFENALHGIDEAHAQHFVGLVQNQQRQPRQFQCTAVHVVDDAPGGSHDHVHSAPQGVELGLVALAAVDRQHVKSLQMRGVLQERLGHLQGELARGHQYQDLRLMFGQIYACQGRQRESRRLAGAGLGLPQHVGARQQHRNGCSLNRRRRFVADVGQGPEYGFGERKIAEAHRARTFVRRNCTHRESPREKEQQV